MAKGKKNKKPQTNYMASQKKEPKTTVLPTKNHKVPPSVKHEPTINGDYLTWRFSFADRNHPEWGWNHLTGNELEEVLNKFHEFETMSQKSLHRGGNHEYPLSNLPQKAHNRLIEIQKDDWDQIMSFRISGAKRVWCLKSGTLMRVLWWDPKHTVYPTKQARKKHEK